jgi:hypothetical protein
MNVYSSLMPKGVRSRRCDTAMVDYRVVVMSLRGEGSPHEDINLQKTLMKKGTGLYLLVLERRVSGELLY